jgi:hypothetical protein
MRGGGTCSAQGVVSAEVAWSKICLFESVNLAPREACCAGCDGVGVDHVRAEAVGGKNEAAEEDAAEEAKAGDG